MTGFGGSARNLVLALLVAGCGEASLPAQGQVLLFIDTDAPLPRAPGESDTGAEPPALFDHLQIAVLRADQPDGEPPLVQRDFALHRGLFARGPISVGVAPPAHAAGFLARARLYRGADVRAGEPAPWSSIEQTLALPEVGADGIIRVLLTLRVDDTALPRVLEQPAGPSEIPKVSLVGSWPGAARVPCNRPAEPGEACVPGGAFWMGDPQLRDNTEVEDAEREHLIVVSPYFIDTHEVTVAELRAMQSELEKNTAPLPPQWSGKSVGLDEDDYSTFTLGPTADDPADTHAELPANAVVWQTAYDYCDARGKQLPTEVMYEFLASGRGEEQNYVWGDDEPACDDTVSARAGLGAYSTFDDDCRPPGGIGGVLSGGMGKRDRVELGDTEGSRVVVDVAGNLTEWMLDWFNAQDEGVWATPGVLTDPVALEPGRFGDRRTVRGGSWRGRYIELRAAARVGRDPTAENRSLGFRCAGR